MSRKVYVDVIAVHRQESLLHNRIESGGKCVHEARTYSPGTFMLVAHNPSIMLPVFRSRRLQSTGSGSRVCAGSSTRAQRRMCRFAVGCVACLALLGLGGDLVFGFLVASGDELLEEPALLGRVVLV